MVAYEKVVFFPWLNGSDHYTYEIEEIYTGVPCI